MYRSFVHNASFNTFEIIMVDYLSHNHRLNFLTIVILVTFDTKWLKNQSTLKSDFVVNNRSIFASYVSLEAV